MEVKESLSKLNEAVDLLSMLEQLVDGLSREDAEVREVAWGGIKLTLRQSKGCVLRARQAFSESGLGQGDRLPGAGTQQAPQKTAFSSLAGRIQKAPTTTGTVRELRVSPTNGDSLKGDPSTMVG